MPTTPALSRRRWAQLAGGALLGRPAFSQGHSEVEPLPAGPHTWMTEPVVTRRVTLEMSLKPFRIMDDRGIRAVAQKLFSQWAPLLRHVEETAVLLWAADGSEILTYRGRLEDEIEWARYIGSANPPIPPPRRDPAEIDIHERARLYIENPPKITYAGLRQIIETLKSVGRSVTGRPVTVGATFDPGPEFARSPWKFARHAEILDGYWIDCGASLKGDTEFYAGFPRGIPDGTPFGAFFGRQAQRFLSDLAFDYIWFSNGFGFSSTAWNVTGALFDGKTFHPEKAGAIRERILAFWRAFRKECPSFRVECRGSNLSTGADLSASASPVREIYNGGFNLVAPPNSPWAAIDGDFGLEISGYLSHIAHLPPGDQFPFRFYLHDPWWLNSPWFDRYGREPHDIYLPLALARVNDRAAITRPSFIEFLTVDNSYGELPDQGPNEVTPHILAAMQDFSDEPGLLTWIYPFSEQHDLVFGSQARPSEVFFRDWFLRNAVSAGLPLNTVVSTENFLASLKTAPDFFRDTVLLAAVPDAGSRLEGVLLDLVAAGHRVFLYGPVTHAGPRLLEALGLKLAEPLTGELEVRSALPADTLRQGRVSSRMLHRDILSGGGIDTVAAGSGEVCATVSDGTRERVFGIACNGLVWLRGSLSSTITRGPLPRPDDPEKHFPAEYLMRGLLEKLGYAIRVEKPTLKTRNPLILAARSNNGFFFSGYCPSTTAALRLRFPYGAPLLLGCEAWLEEGFSRYQMPRAWHRECRCFVQQEAASEVSCVERTSEEPGIRRRLEVAGLKDATVHFYPELRPAGPPVRMNVRYVTEGRRLVARNVTGNLLISW